MIRWNTNFQIEDASIQVGVALIEVTEYKNINDTCVINIKMTDETNQYTVKEYKLTQNRNYNNLDEIYLDLVSSFDNSEII